jgi:hypothetical protein
MPEEKKTPLFVLAQPETFTWPVKVRIPLNGKYGETEFVGTFPNLDDETLNDLVGSKKPEEGGGPKFSDREIAERVLLDFEPIAMPDGTEVTFSQEAKVKLLAKPRVALAVMSTFLAVSRGMAAEKN